jgi:Phage protein Gp138 N-terminal domain
MTSTRAPQASFVLDAAMDHRLSFVHVCLPAQVVAYDATKQTVDVQPCLGKTIFEEEREMNETLPVIPAVPLMFPGSGSYRLTFPIAVNDYVLLVFADRSTDEFYANGGAQIPADVRMHDLSDGFAIPGVIVTPTQLSSVSTSVMVLGKNGHSASPAARQNDATIVNSGTDSAFMTWLSAVTTYINGIAPGTLVLPTSVTGKINAGSGDVSIT